MTKHEEGVRNLEQLEDMLIRIDGGQGYVTRKMVIVLARAVWWLMERWVREHDGKDQSQP